MVAVVTVMGMSLHRITHYTYIYISGLYLFNCGRWQRGVSRKNAFSKVSFFGALYTYKYNTRKLLPLLAENRSRTTQPRLSQLIGTYINGCAELRRFHFKRNPTNSLSLQCWPELRAARFPLLLNPLTFANDSINHYSCSIPDRRGAVRFTAAYTLYNSRSRISESHPGSINNQ